METLYLYFLLQQHCLKHFHDITADIFGKFYSPLLKLLEGLVPDDCNHFSTIVYGF